MSSELDSKTKEMIGEGAFGQVYKIKDKTTNKFIAIKTINIKSIYIPTFKVY